MAAWCARAGESRAHLVVDEIAVLLLPQRPARGASAGLGIAELNKEGIEQLRPGDFDGARLTIALVKHPKVDEPREAHRGTASGTPERLQ
jgi:hypothetical protein